MKKLLIVFLFILFNIAVKAQDHVNHSSLLNHVKHVIESALEGRAKLTDTVITEGFLIFMIDTNGYVTSCKKDPLTKETIVPSIPEINQLLAKYKFKVDPFVIWGIRYPSIAYLPIFVEPK